MPNTYYLLPSTDYQLRAGRVQPAPANEVPEVKLSGSAKRQRALAQLPTISFHLSAFIYHLPLAAEKRRILPLLTD